MLIKIARLMCSTLIYLFQFNLQSAPRRKIRLIEINAKCRHLKDGAPLFDQVLWFILCIGLNIFKKFNSFCLSFCPKNTPVIPFLLSHLFKSMVPLIWAV